MIHLYMNRQDMHCTQYYISDTPTLCYLTNTHTSCNNTIYPTGVFGDHPRAIFEETKVVNIIK